MTNLVVCCDGTWNHPDQKDHGLPAPTNVYKLFSSLNNSDPDKQKRYYHPGVGTDGGFFERLLGGAFGEGLGKNIKSAYYWLAENYTHGDNIYLFGFSRGAYTARSVAGMICDCGLLNLGNLEIDEKWKRVDAAYKEGYRYSHDRASWAHDWAFHNPDDPSEIPIHFIGVWDTVGALGIPDDMALLNQFDRKNYLFHNTELHRKVRHARHAVAIDERRASFSPTLWSKIPNECDAEELWFPGVHCDIGGGYAETGLSDGAFKWMLDESVTKGLLVDLAMVDQIKPDYQGILHDSLTVIFKEMRNQPRPIPCITDQNRLHRSARERHNAPPIAQAPYHPTTIIAGSGTVRTDIFARERWNDTGIYLEAGSYTLSAEGEWLDASIAADPGGNGDGQFHLGEVARMVGSAWGQVERLWQSITHNQQADFKGTKRIEEAPWFSLIGVVANETEVKPDGTPIPHQTFVIGKGPITIEVVKPGYLYCFANDAWDFYFNNSGSVRLVVAKN